MMKVLYLGPERSRMSQSILVRGDEILATQEKLRKTDSFIDDIDFIVSYGYRYIVKPWLLDRFPGRAVNLHISYLPWNRGADPNLWSFLENSPKGVTIHLMDPGIDTGRILVQEQISLTKTETLRTSFEKLSVAIEQLFERNWPLIREDKLTPMLQPSGGSEHRARERAAFEHLLDNGWDTEVSKIAGVALANAR